jgi:uncharacterized protein YdaU (DUF1376 family)
MFWDAYLADTTHLTTEEHGAYMLLLAAMWRRNGCVPDDDKDNARILGLTPAKWRKTKARLASTISGFRVEGGTITQEKLRKTWENTQEKIAKNAANGAKGGSAAARNNKDLALANAKETLERKATIPEPEPEPELKKEDTNVSLSVPDAVPANDLSQAVADYNKAAAEADWPQVQKLTPTRSKQLRQRLKDCGGLDGWRIAMAKACESDFCRGRTAKPWTGFCFDWAVKAANFTKLMEGNYDNRNGTQAGTAGSFGGSGRPGAGMAQAAIAVAERRMREQAGG